MKIRIFLLINYIFGIFENLFMFIGIIINWTLYELRFGQASYCKFIYE